MLQNFVAGPYQYFVAFFNAVMDFALVFDLNILLKFERLRVESIF